MADTKAKEKLECLIRRMEARYAEVLNVPSGMSDRFYIQNQREEEILSDFLIDLAEVKTAFAEPEEEP
jgi:hypothetical protein